MLTNLFAIFNARPAFSSLGLHHVTLPPFYYILPLPIANCPRLILTLNSFSHSLSTSSLTLILSLSLNSFSHSFSTSSLTLILALSISSFSHSLSTLSLILILNLILRTSPFLLIRSSNQSLSHFQPHPLPSSSPPPHLNLIHSISPLILTRSLNSFSGSLSTS